MSCSVAARPPTSAPCRRCTTCRPGDGAGVDRSSAAAHLLADHEPIGLGSSASGCGRRPMPRGEPRTDSRLVKPRRDVLGAYSVGIATAEAACSERPGLDRAEDGLHAHVAAQRDLGRREQDVLFHTHGAGEPTPSGARPLLSPLVDAARSRAAGQGKLVSPALRQTDLKRRCDPCARRHGWVAALVPPRLGFLPFSDPDHPLTPKGAIGWSGSVQGLQAAGAGRERSSVGEDARSGRMTGKLCRSWGRQRRRHGRVRASGSLMRCRCRCRCGCRVTCTGRRREASV